ncbi:MAG: UvrD-helicase domain-containing protein [Myxococcales bacterium]|nr:UvrD-helicase domain-containing protein [Myxococcales bacterium]
MTRSLPPDFPVLSDETAILSGLNEPQAQAVVSQSRRLLILAGAGSGKTRVIIHRIAWLIAKMGVQPQQILAVTFTNKAANELKERIGRLLDPGISALVTVGTFHSLCARLLRQYAGLLGYKQNFSIYDPDDQLTLISRLLKEINVDERMFPPRQIRQYIDHAKNEGIGPTDPRLTQDSQTNRIAFEVYRLYQTRMLETNAVDFGDLLLLMVQLLQTCPPVVDELQWRWRQILVDEFQDTNGVQYQLLRLMEGTRTGLTVVGDDDQSIYRWRGAQIDNILGFDNGSGDTHVVRLEQNYRSTGTILAAASGLIRHNRSRHQKTLWTERPAGEKIRVHAAMTERDEAEWVTRRIDELRAAVDLRQIAIFYRANSLSRVIEETLRKYRIPYRIFGGMRFYERAEIKDILAYLRLIDNPRDVLAFLRAVNTPSRGIGQTTIDLVLETAQSMGINAPDAVAHLVNHGTKAISKRLEPFWVVYRELTTTAATESVRRLTETVLERTGYTQQLLELGSVEAQTRLENIREFLASIEEFEDAQPVGSPLKVGDFLQTAVLASAVDTPDAEAGQVTLMTVHMAKGLEFDAVFLVGVEDDLFPHAQSQEHMDEIEEERRLCYVGMTRARRFLHISYANTRRKFGGVKSTRPSRFLNEIPKETIQLQEIFRPSAVSVDSDLMARIAAAQAAQKRAIAESLHQPLEDGRVLDRSSAQYDDEQPGPGTRVRHGTFGIGTIQKIDGVGQDARVRVLFPSVGEKSIVARFLSRV